MIRALTTAGLAALLSLGACGRAPEDKAADAAAASMEKAGEVQAEKLEAGADQAPNRAEEKALEQHADMVVDSTRKDADMVRKEGVAAAMPR